MKLKVLSWNIFHGKYLDEVIDFLKIVNADIIGLQEIIEKEVDGKRVNYAQVIAEKLGYYYAYYKAFTYDAKLLYDQGNAILSRYPIRSAVSHFLSTVDQHRQTAETQPRVAVEAHVQCKETLLHIFTTHLAYSRNFEPSPMRTLQVKHLLKLLSQSGTILLGDFNSDHDPHTLDTVESVLKNADKNPTAPTWTMYPFEKDGFVVNKLAYRLDHIFVTKDMQVDKFEVLKTKGSDHLPVMVIVEV